MTSMFFDIVLGRIVTLSTKTVIGKSNCTAMCIVAIHTSNPFLIHPALHKGSKHEHLVINLAISKIQPRFQLTESELLTIGTPRMDFAKDTAS